MKECMGNLIELMSWFDFDTNVEILDTSENIIFKGCINDFNTKESLPAMFDKLRIPRDFAIIKMAPHENSIRFIIQISK